MRDIFITLIVVLASRVYAYVQTHQTGYIKYVHFYINYTSTKLLKNNFMKSKVGWKLKFSEYQIRLRNCA